MTNRPASVHSACRRAVVLLATALTVLGMLVAAGPASATWTGANGKLAFARANQIYTINPTGTGLVRLTTADKNYWPRWSPNGQRIAYIHETPAGRRDIWVMNANGTGKQQVTNLGNVTAAGWSRDGATLSFGGGQVGEDTYLMTIRSAAPFGQPASLLGYYDEPDRTEPIHVGGATTWAPDGQSIYFYSPRYPDSPDHYILRYVISTGQVELVWASGGACCGRGSVTQPTVSGDGARLAFTHTTWAPFVRIRGAAAPYFATRAQDEQPAFSPDGRYVALMNDGSGIPRIIIANPDGSGRRVLTNGYQPDWQVKT